MTRTEFEAWAREVEVLRDQALEKYKAALESRERKKIAEDLEKQLNQL